MSSVLRAILSSRAMAAATVTVLVVGCSPPVPTLRVANQSDIATWDPQGLRETYTTEFLANIMEPLVRYGETLEPEPALAERWTRLSPTRLRFFLRRGVRFSNGNPFTADDVVFTFERGSRPDSPFRGNISGILRILKVDDHTVDVETDGPYPVALRELTSMLVFDREWVSLHGDGAYLARHILGTGPFVLKKAEPDAGCELEANPSWWNVPNARHNVSRVVFHPIRSDATRVAALLSGQVDLVTGIPLQDVDRVRAAPELQLIERPSLRTLMVGMNLRDDQLDGSDLQKRNPLKDLRVRRSLYQAIDIDTIVNTIMRGHAEPASAALPRQIHGYDARLDGRLPFDPQQSRQLLADAGYPQGFGLRLDCPNDRFVNDEEICVALVAMLAKVNVRVALRAQPKARYYKDVFTGRSDLFLIGWAAADTMDAHSFVKDLMHTPGRSKGTFNFGGYSNARVDALEALIAREMDDGRRNALIYEAVRIHKEEIGHIPLHTQNAVWGARRGVEVFVPPVDALWLRFARVN